MRQRNVVEWAVLLLSVATIAAVVIILLVEGLAERSPADPTVTLHTEEARTGSLGWILPATVANAGHEAAEAVVIEASGSVDGEDQTADLEIDFLPAGTQVQVNFVFSAPPAGEITAQLVSFRTP